MRSLATRQLVLLIMLSALCVGIQVTPRPPNVEFTSLIVFLVGALFGIFFGATLGVLVMFINGFFSPWGFAGAMLPFQVSGMALVGIGGGIYRWVRNNNYDSRTIFETAVMGAFFTLTYDIITNFGVAVSQIGIPIQIAFATAIISGAIFSVLHIGSNTIVFGLTFYPLTKAIKNLLGDETNWRKGASLT